MVAPEDAPPMRVGQPEDLPPNVPDPANPVVGPMSEAETAARIRQHAGEPSPVPDYQLQDRPRSRPSRAEQARAQLAQAKLNAQERARAAEAEAQARVTEAEVDWPEDVSTAPAEPWIARPDRPAAGNAGAVRPVDAAAPPEQPLRERILPDETWRTELPEPPPAFEDAPTEIMERPRRPEPDDDPTVESERDRTEPTVDLADLATEEIPRVGADDTTVRVTAESDATRTEPTLREPPDFEDDTPTELKVRPLPATEFDDVETTLPSIRVPAEVVPETTSPTPSLDPTTTSGGGAGRPAAAGPAKPTAVTPPRPPVSKPGSGAQTVPPDEYERTRRRKRRGTRH
jgi:hypothetical protein